MEIKGIVERTDMPYKYRTSMTDVSSQRLKWLTSDFLSKWVLQHKVLDIILSENTHIEILKRGAAILKFLSRRGELSREILDQLWACQ